MTMSLVYTTRGHYSRNRQLVQGPGLLNVPQNENHSDVLCSVV